MESPVLIDIAKNGSLKEIPITTEKFLIGRGLQNGLVIENVNISRTHCIIEKSNNQWNILDKSSNGTFLNGKILNKEKTYKLTSGDIISLHDNVKYVFKIPSGRCNVKVIQGDTPLDHSYNKPTSEITVTVNNDTANPLSEEEILNIADSVIEAFEAQSDSDSILNNIIESRGIPEVSSTISTQPTVVTNEVNEQIPELTVERYEEVVTSSNVHNEEGAVTSLNHSVQHQSSQESKATASTSEKTNNFDFAEDELQCSICTEMFIEAVTLSCSHTFCKHCITQWQKNQSFCPICRAKTTLQFATRVLDNFIEKVLENADDETRERRRQLIEQRQASSSSTSTSTSKAKAMPSTSTVNTAAASTSPRHTRRRRAADAPIEISSEEGSDDEEEFSDYSGSNWEEDYDGDDWEEYNGMPGRYYGGYGQCYACGQRGHWANGCPNKRRR